MHIYVLDRGKSFRLLVYIVGGAARKSVLVFTIQSGKCCENFWDDANTCMPGEQ